MKLVTVPLCIMSLLFCALGVPAQKTEITISFSEQFFEALLDAVFQYSAPPEFSLSKELRSIGEPGLNPTFTSAFAPVAGAQHAEKLTPQCSETIRLLRAIGDVRTAVRFRDGEIVAPLAFQGNYNPPLIGCVAFTGVAETVINLEFDRAGQRLIARAKVRDVSLNGTGGIGGGIIARMVQGSIDKKINPIEIVRTDKVSFVLPMQNSNGVKMKATGFSHEIVNGQLSVRVGYEFSKN